MLRLAPLTIPFLLLAACATGPQSPRPAQGSGAVIPQAVTLFSDTVTARMSDGSLCTAVRRGRAGPWQANLAGCPHPWPVQVVRPSPRPRLPLVRSDAAPWVLLGAPSGPLGYGPLR